MWGVLDATGEWFAVSRWNYVCTPIYSTNKTYLYDITEILLKLALKTNNPRHRHYDGVLLWLPFDTCYTNFY